MHNQLHGTLQLCVRLVEQTQPAAALAESKDTYLQNGVRERSTYGGQQLRGRLDKAKLIDQSINQSRITKKAWSSLLLLQRRSKKKRNSKGLFKCGIHRSIAFDFAFAFAFALA